MQNAKTELESKINPLSIECAQIRAFQNYGDYGYKINLNLRQGASVAELQSFLSALDFNYDCGYGGQKLFGIVWLNDGTWLERGEYDGSEWWEHRVRPEIPVELQK
jgi:hypothetical protein